MRGIFENKKLKIFVIAAAVFFILFQLILQTARIDPDIKSYFSSEDEYMEYMRGSVKFSSVEFTFVEMRQGDNFWKIAKDHDTNIDSLIGANIYWEDLLARLGQTVLVPSGRGVLEFITDFSQINALAEEYGVNKEDVEIEKIPFDITKSLIGFPI